MINEETVRNLLTPGDIIPNFKTLCEMFEEKECIKSSNSGKAILKRLKQFCEFEFRGQKIIITDVYDVPHKLEDKRNSNGNKIFVQYIEIVLSAYLAAQKNNKAYCTYKTLYENLGFFNPAYTANYTAEELKVAEISLRSFYLRTMGQFKKITNRALNNMVNRSLIDFSVERIIVLPNGESFVANDRQTNAVLNIENDILNQMGLYDKRIVALRGMGSTYQKKVNEALRKHHGWDYSYQRVKIIAADSFRLLRDMDRNLAKLQLNKEIVNLIDRNALSELKANRKQFADGKIKQKYSFEYLEQQYHLSKCLLSLDPLDEKYLLDTINEPTDWELFS